VSATDPGTQPSLLIRSAQLIGHAGQRDLRISAGRIVALARNLPAQRGDELIEARGNVLLRGLHDHHLHLFATAAARASIDCSPSAVHDEDGLRATLRRCSVLGEDWIRGTGFHESVCTHLDRHWLDAVCPERPLRIQHRSGMLWVLNTAALRCLRLDPGETLPPGVERGEDGAPSGRFLDLDAWLGARLERAWPALGEVSAELARFGITGVTDAGARNGSAAWQALQGACARGELCQRVLVMGNEELHGLGPALSGRIAVGALKIYLREATLPALDALVDRMREAHAHQRPVAVHCVTRVELAFALAAFADAGTLPGDRIEHAAIADEYAVRTLASLGVAVVTQPHFIAERGAQYLIDVDADDHELLYRGAGFLFNGVALAAGSDAPYGSTDPWAAMRAAITRRTQGGLVIGRNEHLAPSQALALFAGDPWRPGSGSRPLAVGDDADLCLLGLPWSGICADPDARHVALTVCAGRIVYERSF